jgi:hypothetical protein
LKKAFEKWLKTVLTDSDYLERIIKLNFDGTAETLSLEDLINIITGEVNIMGTVSNINSTSTKETEPKTNSIPKIEAVKHSFNRSIKANRIKRNPGVYCVSAGSGDSCRFEAEWNLNGNLYCETHFREQAKFNEDNGIGVVINDNTT